MTAMDGLSGSVPGHDRIQVTRSLTMGGQEFRLHLEHFDDTTVTVDLLVGRSDQPVGRLRVGRVVRADVRVLRLLEVRPALAVRVVRHPVLHPCQSCAYCDVRSTRVVAFDV